MKTVLSKSEVLPVAGIRIGNVVTLKGWVLRLQHSAADAEQ
jgi:hypothetical protein